MVCRLLLVLSVSLFAACESGSGSSEATDGAQDPITETDGGQVGPVDLPDLTGLTGPCTADTDCVFACAADYCGGCYCGGVGILSSQQAELDARKAALAAGCQPEVECAVWPAPPSARCATDGSCFASFAASTEGIRACSDDADCTVSTTAYVCSLCPCGGTGVATTELATWLERVEDMRFYCPPTTQEDIDSCAGSGMCAPGAPACVDGLCEALLE